MQPGIEIKVNVMECDVELMQEYFELTTSRGVLLVNRLGSICYVNDRFFSMVGCVVSAVQGVLFEEFLTRLPEQPGWQGPNQASFMAVMGPILTRACHQEKLYFQSDQWLQFSGRPMSSGGYVLSLTEVTAFCKSAHDAHQANKNMVKALADIAENRDNDTGEHVLKVARLTHEIAIDLHERGLFQDVIDDSFLSQLGLASMLHDVGKVAVPDSVLLKPGRLTPEELPVMQNHVLAGFRMIRKIQDLQTDSAYFQLAAGIARSHHEKYAGGGYPEGIAGEAIPLEARIVAVSDVFDALTSWRPYKEPWSEEKALEFINKNSGVMFDPQVVRSLNLVLEKRQQQSVMRWEPTMSVGQAEMDKDHRILIDLINQLGLAYQRADVIILDFILDELYNYTVRHFQREEQYMQEGRYPHLERHRRLHQEFTGQVVDLRRQFLRHPNLDLALNLSPLLGTWLTEHIQKVDRDYQQFFLTLPFGSSVELDQLM